MICHLTSGRIMQLSPQSVISNRDWCFLPLDWVCALSASLANPPPREGATANWFSMCVVTFLLHWSRRRISELWQRAGQARLGECQGRGEGEERDEEEESPVRINAGEDKIPKLEWRGLAVNNHGGTSPWTLRMGPKDLSKEQTLGWGLRAWVIGWIKGRDPGLMGFPSKFPGEEEISPEILPWPFSPLLRLPRAHWSLLTPERIYLGTQDWIMLVIVWAF